MPGPRLINVYELPLAPNLCNQTLREVISLPNASMAHVIVNPGDVSRFHQHKLMSEVYFILEGDGILYHNEALEAERGVYIVLPPKTPHKLRNIGKSDLKHLVFAVPPFILSDIEIIEAGGEEPHPRKYIHQSQPIMAPDGAIVYELMSNKERKSLDMALAEGFLPEGKKAKPHRHRISDELYYVISGVGKAAVGSLEFDVKKDSVVMIPKNYIHALDNERGSGKIEILCVSSPAYSDGDFFE